ncbi:MAG: hypothetical protein GXO54_06035 [Chloroflexi bacterium]|nr:hypothetical protein [Chloroflexota bacterium]
MKNAQRHGRQGFVGILVLLIGFDLVLAACLRVMPADMASSSPGVTTSPQGSPTWLRAQTPPTPMAAVARATPTPSAPGEAVQAPKPTTNLHAPWNQGGPWPTPQQRLEVRTQTESAALTAINAARLVQALYPEAEVQLGAGPAVMPWTGDVPGLTWFYVATSPTRVEAAFRVPRASLDAWHQVLLQAGWRAYPNVNPELAHITPYTVLLEWHRTAAADEQTLSIILVRRADAPDHLWGWLTLHTASLGVMEPTRPALPWGLPTAGVQVQKVYTQGQSPSGRITASVVAIRPWGDMTAMWQAWDAALTRAGWRAVDEDAGRPWRVWVQGERTRVLVRLPAVEDGALPLLAYELRAIERPSPVQPPDISADLARDIASALLLRLDITTLASPTTLHLGTWPEDGEARLWPQGTVPWVRVAPGGPQVGMYDTQRSADEAARALASLGWVWTDFTREGLYLDVLSYMALPHPTAWSDPGAALWRGGLCYEGQEAGWWAALDRQGVLIRSGSQQGFGCPAPAPNRLPWPEVAYTDLAGLVLASPGTPPGWATTWSLAAFTLPHAADALQAWRARVAAQGRQAGWVVTSPENWLLAMRPQEDRYLYIYTLPLPNEFTLVVLVAVGSIR